MRDRLRLRLSAKKRNSAASESSSTNVGRATNNQVQSHQQHQQQQPQPLQLNQHQPQLQQQPTHQLHGIDNHAQMAQGMTYGNWHDLGGKDILKSLKLYSKKLYKPTFNGKLEVMRILTSN